jgi:hypothetical protein
MQSKDGVENDMTASDSVTDYFISPLCPICGEKISGVIGTDKLWCFECKTYWNLDLRLETD